MSSKKAGASSNAADIREKIDRLINCFDLTLPGVNGSFAEDMMDEFSTGVYERCRNESAPDGSRWTENQGQYGTDKKDEGLPVGIGTDADRSDMMLSLVNLKGERTCTPDLATMTYGVTPTAKDKANWFTYGSSGSQIYWEYSGAKNQAPRPFWGFDDAIVTAIITVCQARIERALKY